MLSPVSRLPASMLLLLCACGASEVPLPTILSVTPTSLSTSECTDLQVELDGVLPLTLDYGTSSAEFPTSTQVGVGRERFSIQRMEDQGKRLFVSLPAGLPQGQQDVRLMLSDGQESVLREVLQVTPPLAITGFSIDYVLDQIRQEPFTIRVRALGPDTARFQGKVKLRANRGTIEPPESAPFVNGVLEQQVIMDDTGGNNVLIEVEDCVGHLSHSNEFRLDPRP